MSIGKRAGRAAIGLVVLATIQACAVDDGGTIAHAGAGAVRSPSGPQPLLVLDYVGGSLVAGPVPNAPSLTLYPDGRLVLGDGGGRMAPLETTLGPDRVRELLALIIETHDVYSITEQTVRRQAEREAGDDADHLPAPPPPESSATVIRVRRADGRNVHEISVLGVRYLAEAYPQADSIQRLFAVEQAIERVRHEAYAADGPGLAHHLQIANEQRARLFPETEPFTAEDLEAAARYLSGRAVVTFARRDPNSPSRQLAARLDYGPDGQAGVEVYTTRRPD